MFNHPFQPTNYNVLTENIPGYHFPPFLNHHNPAMFGNNHNIPLFDAFNGGGNNNSNCCCPCNNNFAVQNNGPLEITKQNIPGGVLYNFRAQTFCPTPSPVPYSFEYPQVCYPPPAPQLLPHQPPSCCPCQQQPPQVPQQALPPCGIEALMFQEMLKKKPFCLPFTLDKDINTEEPICFCGPKQKPLEKDLKHVSFYQVNDGGLNQKLNTKPIDQMCCANYQYQYKWSNFPAPDPDKYGTSKKLVIKEPSCKGVANNIVEEACAEARKENYLKCNCCKNEQSIECQTNNSTQEKGITTEKKECYQNTKQVALTIPKTVLSEKGITNIEQDLTIIIEVCGDSIKVNANSDKNKDGIELTELENNDNNDKDKQHLAIKADSINKKDKNYQLASTSNNTDNKDQKKELVKGKAKSNYNNNEDPDEIPTPPVKADKDNKNQDKQLRAFKPDTENKTIKEDENRFVIKEDSSTQLKLCSGVKGDKIIFCTCEIYHQRLLVNVNQEENNDIKGVDEVDSKESVAKLNN